MLGVEKNTMESRSAFSTSAAASASTASEPPMIVIRRCLRVICRLFPQSSIEPEILQALIELAQPFGVVGNGPAGLAKRADRLVALAHDEIGTHQAQPA